MRSILRLATVSVLVAVILSAVEFGWSIGHWSINSRPLQSMRGWKTIQADHPVVRRSPFGTFAEVRTDNGVYDVNAGADSDLRDFLARQPVE